LYLDGAIEKFGDKLAVVVFHPYWDAVSFPCSNTRMRWVSRPGIGIRQGAIFDGAYDADMGDRRRVESPENLAMYDSMYTNRSEQFSFEFATKKLPDVNGAPACSITVTTIALTDFPESKELRLFVDIIEDGIDVGQTASTITIANNVLMGVLPDTFGFPIGPQSAGTVSVNSFYCEASGLVRNPDNARLIVFVQDYGALPLPWEAFSGTWPVTLEAGPYPVQGVARFDQTPFQDYVTAKVKPEKMQSPIHSVGKLLQLTGSRSDIFEIRVYGINGQKKKKKKRGAGFFNLDLICAGASGIRIIDVKRNGETYFRNSSIIKK